MKKGLDRCFLHYGIKQEDMNIIEQTCIDSDIDAEWMKENILKPYQDEKNNQNFVEEKKLTKIMKQALKRV
jgi:non-homologous end joining protein Ku